MNIQLTVCTAAIMISPLCVLTNPKLAGKFVRSFSEESKIFFGYSLRTENILWFIYVRDLRSWAEQLDVSEM